MNRNRRKMRGGAFWSLAATLLIFPVCSAQAQQCTNTVIADVVVFDTPIMFNRLGAQNPNWITYALERDVVAIEGETPGQGNAQMRKDKRIRPLVLRVNEGDCLQVNFKNWLAPQAILCDCGAGVAVSAIDDQVAGRFAGFVGLQRGDIKSMPRIRAKTQQWCSGGSAVYKYYAPRQPRNTLLTVTARHSAEKRRQEHIPGMFALSTWNRKGHAGMQPADGRDAAGLTGHTDAGQPIITTKSNTRTPPPGHTKEGGQADRQYARQQQDLHSDLNAIIAGPNPDRTFPPSTYPLESVGKKPVCAQQARSVQNSP